MNKELENINKLIEQTTEDITTFNNAKKEMLDQKRALEKILDDAHKKLVGSVEAIDAQIKALEKKRNEITAPIHTEIDNLSNSLRDVEHIINKGEAKSKELDTLNRIKTIIEKTAAGYYITIVDSWGTKVGLGKFYKNNYRPEGWTIIDILIKGTSAYCQSDKAKSPRKLFDLLTTYSWSITLSSALAPGISKSARVEDCPKCKGRYTIKHSKACPVCQNVIEKTCESCGYRIDCSADDKHRFSDEPDVVTVRSI